MGRAIHYKRMHLFHFEIIEVQKSGASLSPAVLSRIGEATKMLEIIAVCLKSYSLHIDCSLYKLGHLHQTIHDSDIT